MTGLGGSDFEGPHNDPPNLHKHPLPTPTNSDSRSPSPQRRRLEAQAVTDQSMEEDGEWSDWDQWRNWVHGNVDWLVKKITKMENAPPLTEEFILSLKNELFAVVEAKITEGGGTDPGIDGQPGPTDRREAGGSGQIAAGLGHRFAGKTLPLPGGGGANPAPDAPFEQIKKLVENCMEAQKNLLTHQFNSAVKEVELKCEEKCLEIHRSFAREMESVNKKMFDLREATSLELRNLGGGGPKNSRSWNFTLVNYFRTPPAKKMLKNCNGKSKNCNRPPRIWICKTSPQWHCWKMYNSNWPQKSSPEKNVKLWF